MTKTKQHLSKINQTLKNIKTIKQKLQKQNKTITFGESCTGGLIANLFSKIDGISSVFNGSLVSYSNNVKIKYLKVKPKTIKKHGVVSTAVTKQMAIGVKKFFKSNVAVSISGIAGPDGGSNKKPVGSVSICVVGENKIKNKMYYFKGDRQSIQFKSAKQAIKMILKII